MSGVLISSLSSQLVAQVSSSSSSGASSGTGLMNWAQQRGLMPLVVVGGLIVLIAVFTVIAKNRRES